MNKSTLHNAPQCDMSFFKTCGIFYKVYQMTGYYSYLSQKQFNFDVNNYQPQPLIACKGKQA